MSVPVTPLYKIISDAVRKVARSVLRDFSEVEKLQVSRKGVGDFVTHTDKRVEAVLRDELLKARPQFGFLGEETGYIAGEDKQHVWIVDPIDGTTNFMHGLPHFAFSIALEHHGEIVAGMVFDPVKNEEFWAEKGRGAYLNGDRLRVSNRQDLSMSLIATGIPFAGCKDHEAFLKDLVRVMPKVAGIRRMGAASLDLAYVAAGRCEAYWENTIQYWDVAAGLLLVREAGGQVTTKEGAEINRKSGSILAGNSSVYGTLLKLLGGKA